MTLATYSGLKVAVQDWLNDTQVANRADDFIALAEARFKSEIRFRDMLQRVQTPLNVESRFLALPTDYLDGMTLRLILNDGRFVSPREVNLHSLTNSQRTQKGLPEFYTLHEEIEFDAPVDTSLTATAEMVYYKALPALSASQADNALLKRAPSVYLYGALIEAGPFVFDDQRVSTWNALYQSAKDALLAADKRSRNIGPLVSRVAGRTP